MDDIQAANAVAQTATTLSILRDEAIESLIEDREGSSLTTTGVITENGHELTTTDNNSGDVSKLVIDGDETPETGFANFTLSGEYDIARIDGDEVSLEKATFNLRQSNFDEFRGLKHYEVSMTRTDRAGNPIESYHPAESRVKREGGQTVYDNNGQPVRLATRVDGVNCQPDYSRPNSGKLDCEYIVEEANGDTFSYNETRSKNQEYFQHRSVIRDKDTGKVFGIVNQQFKLNEQGLITQATTTARLPKGG